MRILTTYKIDDCPLWDKSVDYLVIPRIGIKKPALLAKIAEAKRDISIACQLIKKIRDYDILVTCSDRAGNLFAVFQAIFGKRIKHVMLNCLWGYSNNPLSRFLRPRFYRLISKSVDKFIVFSSHEINVYHKAFRIPTNKFKYIPFYFTPLCSQFKSHPGDYIFSGGHPAYRDFETLINAVENLNIKCVIATQTPEYFAKYKMPTNITIRHLPQDEYFKMMAESRIVVVPLKKNMLRSAGQRSYLDAMHLGKPVVVCDDNQNNDYITNSKDGFIIPPGDISLLNLTIKKLLDPSEEIKILSEKAKEKSVSFSIENTIRQILYLLNKLLQD